MRTKAIFLACVIAAAFVFGCSRKEEAVGKAPEDLETPAKTVEYLFNAIRGDKSIDTAALFSKEIPADLAAKYVENFTNKTEVTMFNITGAKEDAGDAKATVKYLYYDKKVGQGDVQLSAKKLREQRMALKIEDGKWLIRYTGDDFDTRVEERVFYDCLNTVMDAAIAQELYYGAQNSYTPMLGELEDIQPINTSRCAEFKIETADEYEYEITAITLNRSHCRILATDQAVLPMKYSECLSLGEVE